MTHPRTDNDLHPMNAECVLLVQTNGDRMDISWRHAEEHALTAITLGRQCRPAEAALEASPLTTMADIASAKCCFPLAKQRYMPLSCQRAASGIP